MFLLFLLRIQERNSGLPSASPYFRNKAYQELCSLKLTEYQKRLKRFFAFLGENVGLTTTFGTLIVHFMGKNKRKKKKNIKISRELILTILKDAGHPLFMREIIHLLHVPPEMKQTVKRLVRELVKKGDIILLKGNRYGLTRQMKLVTGTLVVHPDGFGFVQADQKDQQDVFIPPRKLKGAIHGDLVTARIERDSPKGPEGSVIRIIQRNLREVVGIFHTGRNLGVVIPENERLHTEILIPDPKRYGNIDGQAVIAKILHFSRTGTTAEGEIIKVLGDPDDIKVQSKIVVNKYQLPHEFSKRALTQAQGLPDWVRGQDLSGRRDLRNLPLMTIDGEDAKDFDDAVHVKKTAKSYILTVAIADVSHYVDKDSPLDLDALQRGTSVYFPDQVIPMLPEKLSNGICSLVPDEERLAVVAKIYFDHSGAVRKSTFFKSVIKSHQRFTYKTVQKLLDGKDKKLRKKFKPFLKTLGWMEELARLLMERRKERGSIDFDLPEPEVILGLTGELESIVHRQRSMAHRLIEEFMIAANEAVARFLSDRSIPTLYRIHEPPEREKIEDVVEFLRSLGHNVKPPKKITPFWCQKILGMVEGRPEEYVVNSMLLRTMNQAVYSPENKGHFGLASPTYLHFTSPIRRYPDLIVHRVLKGNLRRTRKRPVYKNEELKILGQKLSQEERTAMEAEREMLDRLKVRYMEEKIGEVFHGIISSVSSFGMFVELKEILISGLVRLVDMADDYYEFDSKRHILRGRRSGKVYKLGQEVVLRLISVNKTRRHINFEIIQEER